MGCDKGRGRRWPLPRTTGRGGREAVASMCRRMRRLWGAVPPGRRRGVTADGQLKGRRERAVFRCHEQGGYVLFAAASWEEEWRLPL